MVAVNFETSGLLKIRSALKGMSDRAKSWEAVTPDLEDMVRQEAVLQRVQLYRPIMRPINTDMPFMRQTMLPLEGDLRVTVVLDRQIKWTPDFLDRLGERCSRWIVEGA